MNNTQSRTHKHCVASVDDDEPENNFYSTRCTGAQANAAFLSPVVLFDSSLLGVPHPPLAEEFNQYIFPFCFAQTETVRRILTTTPTGSSISADAFEVVPLSEVKLGDLILSSDFSGTRLTYSPVIAIPHKRNDIEAIFYHFELSTGDTENDDDTNNDIKVMSKHVMSVLEQCAQTTPAPSSSNHAPTLKLADEVVLSDCLLTVNGYKQISAIHQHKSRAGLMTVVTMEEMVVVNGVVASPFAGNHAAAHAYYNVYRWVYKWLTLLLRHLMSFVNNNDCVGREQVCVLEYGLQSEVVRKGLEGFQELVVWFVQLSP